MAVQPTWSQFRYLFAIGGATSNQLLGRTTNLLTYIAGPPARITQAAGNFVTDHHVGGMYTDITGTALNDSRVLLASASAFQLTLDASETLQAEGPINSTVESIFRDVDATESFPSVEHPTTDLVRSGGFDGGFTGIDKPYTGPPMTISINGGAADAVFGVADYHWYLSQRTDEPTEQYLTCVQKADSGGNSYSGTVLVNRTELANKELQITTTPNMNQVRGLFINCHLHVKRVSDGAIQWVDLYREMQLP